MLDTVVYIDVLQSRSLELIRVLLEGRIVNHSSVALPELTHNFGRLDPGHPETPGVLQSLSQVVTDIPVHRLSRPSERAFGEAGILSGLAARLTTRPHNMALLNDALLLLHAQETGRVLLTRNVADFDLLQQLVTDADVLFYHRAD